VSPAPADPAERRPAAEPDAAPGAAGPRSEVGARTPDSGAAPPPASSAGVTEDLQVTVVPGITRYHRDGCILIRFLGEADLEHMTRADAEAAACVPCRACQPDKATSDA
jgi:hypothetical protein